MGVEVWLTELEDCVMVDEALAGRKSAAISDRESRDPAVRSVAGQPLLHGLDLQQPMNGGLEFRHVYHWLPDEHC